MDGAANVTNVPEQLLERAQTGDVSSLGHLLELYRNYLRVMAQSLVGQGLRARLDPSDLVQETFLEAHRDFPRFLGTTEGQLLAWLRRILVRNLADQVKRHRSQGRDLQRQESLEALLDRSSLSVQQALAAGVSSPSLQACRREQSVLVADALARLPADSREVILLRHVEHLKFEEIASRMGRSCGAVRMLWVRALERLNRELEKPT